jgi:hypothetical protein
VAFVFKREGSGWYILRIGELYEVERDLKENPKLDPVALPSLA